MYSYFIKNRQNPRGLSSPKAKQKICICISSYHANDRHTARGLLTPKAKQNSAFHIYSLRQVQAIAKGLSTSKAKTNLLLKESYLTLVNVTKSISGLSATQFIAEGQ